MNVNNICSLANYKASVRQPGFYKATITIKRGRGSRAWQLSIPLLLFMATLQQQQELWIIKCRYISDLQFITWHISDVTSTEASREIDLVSSLHLHNTTFSGLLQKPGPHSANPAALFTGNLPCQVTLIFWDIIFKWNKSTKNSSLISLIAMDTEEIR